jgi:peptidyl-prolyl cis-trans isomerase D
MLRGIRNASNTWLGRILMGAVMTLLAGIFALWGINDIFRNFGQSSLAKIGHTEISSQQFRQVYNDRLQAMIRQTGKPISPEVANAIGLPRQVLSEMVAQDALDEQARKLRLGIADAEISKRITSDPMFQIGGRFNPAQFQDVLRNAGYTEQRYVAEQRNTTLRQQLIESVSGDVALPKAWLDAINQFQNQQRSIQYLALGPAQAGDIPAPTDEELSKYFDSRKIMFRAPEYRKIVTVTATPAELAKTVEISDDDVKKVFDENRSRFITPERRHVERMTFPNMTEAQAASDRIKAGTTFAALAAERGVKEQDLDFGTVPKSLILDPAVADAAFALKEGEVSAPVQTKDGGAVLVTVAKIIPEDAKSFADVAPQIRNDMALVRVKKTIQDIHDKIEDARAGGATLEEAAQKLNLPVVTYDAVDESGRDPNGKPIDKLPHARDVVNAAFQTDVGVDNDPIDADGGYIWYDVANITPAHERKLDEVKDQVTAQWRDAEVASRLKAKAADILDKLKNGGTFESLAADNGIKVATATDITRSKPMPDISSPMVDAIFHTAKDAYASAAGDKPTQWIVFRVTDIKTPDVDANAPAMKQIDQAQSRQVGDDIFGQYMAWLEQDLGISINTTVLQQALGNSSTPPPDIN